MAEWLKATRKGAGKTQRQAGDHLGKDSQTISNWETATHPITADDLLRLAAFYGRDLSPVFTVEGGGAPSPEKTAQLQKELRDVTRGGKRPPRTG